MYTLRGLGLTTPDLISQAAAKYGVPLSLALAVAQKESGLNQAAVGTSGERGVFQLMPGTAQQLGVDPTNLDQNVDGGVRYLSQMYSEFGDWHTALEAYNGGPGNVQKGTVSAAAQAYADSLAGSVGPDTSTVDSSVLDASGSPVDTPSVGLSGVAWVGLAVAAVAVLYMVSD